MRLSKKKILFRFVKKSSILCVALLSHFLGNTVFGDSVPLAILGGQVGFPYAALIQPDGFIAKLNGLPPTGTTYRVAMNLSQEGIVGGTDGLNAYAALVSPDGVLNRVGGLIAPGEIYSVVINNAGTGMIGGGHFDTNVPYAALVSKNGVATALKVPVSGLVYSVALDSSGEGVVGGVGPLNSAYASLVSPNGTVKPVAGLPSTGGIFWVAINDSKLKFLGGKDNASIYAAFVDREGSLMPVAGLPQGTIYSVALNPSGNAIISGTSLTLPYAALVSKEGAVTPLGDLPTHPGIIYNVAINDSGAALIAGFSKSTPYGSLVAPDGALTPLIDLPTGKGLLDGAALHAAGVGIVGGSSSDAPFVALVAPNGTLTYLDGLPPHGEINTISIAMLDNLVPKSLGSFDSFANTQFALSDALTQHCIIHKSERWQTCSPRSSSLSLEDQEGISSLWLSTFGNYVHEKKQHALPSFSNKIAGVLLGLDYKGISDVVIGGGLVYAYNSVHCFNRCGKASINQESAVLYATWATPHVYLNAALWGGIFQSTHKRRSLTFIRSTAKPSGWNLSPHFELSLPFQIAAVQKFVVDPFIALDWANSWQSHFREKGVSGFNVKLNNQHVSIFRSELGFRLFETMRYGWGHVIFEEKISYINRTPIHKGKGRASFIGAASSFDVETVNSSSQNQGSIQLHMECIPSRLKNMYASFDYQGAFGSSFQSHMLTFAVGKNF